MFWSPVIMLTMPTAADCTRGAAATRARTSSAKRRMRSRIVAGQRGVHGEAEQVLAAESQVNVFQIVQRARKEGGGNQHQEGERHL